MAIDPDHWLYKLDARGWIDAALGELGRAEESYRTNNPRAGHAACRRAAGMALNGALVCQMREAWGRSFMDHLIALQRDAEAPEEVQKAAAALVEAPAPGGALVALRSKSGDERTVEAARTVMAHAYTIVARHEGDRPEASP